MAHTYTRLLVHVVFSTKGRIPYLLADRRSEVFSYMGGVLKTLACEPIQINGMADHVHLAFAMPASLSLAKVVGLVKGNTSKWGHKERVFGHACEWQRGYSAFSVSVSGVAKVTRYIANQEVHHRKTSFEEELVRFFKHHGIEYDPRYLLD